MASVIFLRKYRTSFTRLFSFLANGSKTNLLFRQGIADIVIGLKTSMFSSFLGCLP